MFIKYNRGEILLKFKDLHINIKIRLFVNFIQKLTQMTVFPFMAIYFSKYFGATVAGILMIISVVAAFFSSFYGGYFADLYGRKRVLLEGEKYRFLTMILMAFFNSPWLFSPTITFILFAINNVIVGLITPANEAILIDVSTPKNRKLLYSLNYWSLNLSIALGSMIGAFFYKNHFFDLLLTTSLASLITYFLVKLYIIETNPPKINQKIKKATLTSIFASYKLILKDRLFTIYLIVGILTLSLEFQLVNFIAIKLSNEFGIQKLFGLPYLQFDGVKILGFLRMENTLLVVILGALVLKLTDKLNNKIILFVGVVLFTSGFSLLSIFNNICILILATFIFTIGELLYVPIHQSLLAELIDDTMRSQYIAVNSLRSRGALIIASLCVTLGSFVPNWTMALLYISFGAVSIILYSIIFSNLKNKIVH